MCSNITQKMAVKDYKVKVNITDYSTKFNEMISSDAVDGEKIPYFPYFPPQGALQFAKGGPQIFLELHFHQKHFRRRPCER